METERQRTAEFRFYEELNDYLPPGLRKRSCNVELVGTPEIGELCSALGVPLAEIDLLLVDGESSRFDTRLSGGERVAAYPVFERFDITPLAVLPGRPLCPFSRR